MKERTLQRKILNYLRAQPDTWWCKYPGGMYGQIGVPDIIGCCMGRFLAFEVKRPKTKKAPAGKPTKTQLKAIKEITSSNGIATIVYSLEEVIHVIDTCRNSSQIPPFRMDSITYPISE